MIAKIIRALALAALGIWTALMIAVCLKVPEFNVFTFFIAFAFWCPIGIPSTMIAKAFNGRRRSGTAFG
jgi:hypothetical protein